MPCVDGEQCSLAAGRLRVLERADVVMRKLLGRVLAANPRLDPARDLLVLLGPRRPRYLSVGDVADEDVPERVLELVGDGGAPLPADEFLTLERVEGLVERGAVGAPERP